MVRHSAALAVMVALGLARDPGCGGGDGPEGGVNAPCTRTKDCRPSLVCSEGVCTEPDSGVVAGDAGAADARDAGVVDAAADGG